MTCLRPLKEQMEELRVEPRALDFETRDPSTLMLCSLRWQARDNEQVTIGCCVS